MCVVTGFNECFQVEKIKSEYNEKIDAMASEIQELEKVNYL